MKTRRHYTLVMELAEVLQILDALELRVETWDNTCKFARGERSEDLVVEEHTDVEEAEGIVCHYRDIIKNIETQLVKHNPM